MNEGLSHALLVGWLEAPFVVAFLGAVVPMLGDLPLLLCCIATGSIALQTLLSDGTTTLMLLGNRIRNRGQRDRRFMGGQDRAAQAGAGCHQHKQGHHAAAHHIHGQHLEQQISAQHHAEEAAENRQQDQQLQQPDRSHRSLNGYRTTSYGSAIGAGLR